MRVLGVLLLSVMMAQFAQARSVDIAIPTGQTLLSLSNPSNVTVNYDITCHKVDGSTTVVNLTSQTIASKAKMDVPIAIVDSGKCAGDANPEGTYTDYEGNKFYTCLGSTTYANAPNLCGVGNSFCMPKSTSNCGYWHYSCSGASFWVKSESPTEYQPSCGSWGAAYVSGTSAVAVSCMSGSGYVRQSAGESFKYFYYAFSAGVGTTQGGAFCCAGGSESHSGVCRITINNTEVDARLQSPSFLGGAPF